MPTFLVERTYAIWTIDYYEVVAATPERAAVLADDPDTEEPGDGDVEWLGFASSGGVLDNSWHPFVARPWDSSVLLDPLLTPPADGRRILVPVQTKVIGTLIDLIRASGDEQLMPVAEFLSARLAKAVLT